METTAPSSQPCSCAVRHETAKREWTDYFNQIHAAQPADSLLSTLIEKLKKLPGNQWAKWLFELGLVELETAQQIHAMVSRRPVSPDSNDCFTLQVFPNAKSWALFLLVVDAMSLGDEESASAVDDLAKWVPPQGCQLPKFVRHCWDGYFLFSRQVARRFYGEKQSIWPMEIPCVLVDLRRQNLDWLAISADALLDTSFTLGDTSGYIETRFARNEFQMPALWQGVGKQSDRRIAFSAIKKNVAPLLRFGDMGIAKRKALEFSDQKSATEVNSKSFSLPGLLWAMGLDGGVRRQDGELNRINNEFNVAFNNVQSGNSKVFTPKLHPSANEVLQAVQSAVTSGNGDIARFAYLPTSDRSNQVPSFVLLDYKNYKTFWDESEQTHCICINDSPEIRLKGWEGARFYESAGGKSMPVVFGVEEDYKVDHWAWGSSEDWGLEDNGETRFKIWPHDASGAAFCNKDNTWRLHVVDASVLNMSNCGSIFKDYFVLYLRISWP